MCSIKYVWKRLQSSAESTGRTSGSVYRTDRHSTALSLSLLPLTLSHTQLLQAPHCLTWRDLLISLCVKIACGARGQKTLQQPLSLSQIE